MSHLLRTLIFCLLCSAAPAWAAPIDGDPQVTNASNKGTYIWRNASGQIEIRTVAGRNNPFTFNATLESPAGFGNTGAVGLENADQVSKSGNQMDLAFQMWSGGVDGLVIRGNSTQNLCLRQASGANIYLGANTTRATAPVDLTGNGACGSAGPDVADGLYVLRPTASTFQVRLVSKDSAQVFSGTISADKNYAGVTPYKLESSDELNRPNARTIDLTMQTWPGGQDGVNFTVSNASVCLDASASASSNVPVFMGSSLTDASPVSMPINLTGAGTCGNVTPPPVSPPGRKYNAGHYVRLLSYNDLDAGIDQADQPGVTGVLKMYRWRDLEPSRGNYDFSEIEQDLVKLSSRGLQLIVMLEDKTFKNENPVPNYLNTADNVRRNRPGGFTAIRWSPTVVSRTKALITAMGNRFDSNPYFEGLSTQESAPGLDGPVLDATGYTPEKYRDALVDVLSHATEAMPTSRVFWYVNFFPRKLSYMGDVIEAVKDKGVVVGGPDVLPDEHALQAHLYPTLRSFQGQLPILGQVEAMCFHHEHADPNAATKYWTMPELFSYARNNLKVNYMIWVNFRVADFPDSYTVDDAWPVIRNNPSFNN